MRIGATAYKVLLAPQTVTDGAVTGSWVDIQGLIGDVENVKGVWMVGAGTTAGTASGSIQSAEDTAGTDLTTRHSFTNVTSAGGDEEGHFSIGTHRYVRFLGDVQSGKDMLVTSLLVAADRNG